MVVIAGKIFFGIIKKNMNYFEDKANGVEIAIKEIMEQIDKENQNKYTLTSIRGN